MLIASLKPGHDGTIAALEDGKLLFSYEAEKNSYPRYDNLNVETLLCSFEALPRFPDVVAHSGWPKGFHSRDKHQQACGYFGSDGISEFEKTMFGRRVRYFASSHERSHIWCAYGMSPFAQGKPVYCLVYEGNIGRFYEIDKELTLRPFPTTLVDPGNKYSFLFSLADPGAPEGKGHFRFENAGKLMALAAFGEGGDPTPAEQDLIDRLLRADNVVLDCDKAEFRTTPWFNCGVEAPHFKQLARRFSDALFARFLKDAQRIVQDKRPLLIAGGCGLNCDWNRRWLDSGLFSDVFVPPVTNDAGSAIGTAVDAQRAFTGSAKIAWDVYSGVTPLDDRDDRVRWEPLDLDALANDLCNQHVVAVMRGRCEIGPRALGARSLLASPSQAEMTRILNRIKGRENYRPVAPMVVEEEADSFFDLPIASPHMLFFARVRDSSLRAVTHVDGTARPQTVNQRQNPFLHALLRKVGDKCGVPVLCNTSLNYPGRGFINSEQDLVDYCMETGIARMVSGDRYGRLG